MDTELTTCIRNGQTDRQIGRQFGIHHNKVASVRKKLGMLPNAATPLVDYIDSPTYVCSRCHKERDRTEFSYGRKDTPKEYRYSYCNNCRNQAFRFRKANNIESYLRDAGGRLVRRAKTQGVVVVIDAEYLIDLYNEQQGRCFYTDRPMTTILGQGVQKTNVSIDKIVPENGYVKGNVVLCQDRINTIKNDVTLDEMRQWMPAWYERVIRMWRKNGLFVADVGKGEEF